MCVVSECCCKEVYYRYPHNNYYFPLLHLYQLFFWQHHPYIYIYGIRYGSQKKFPFFVNCKTLFYRCTNTQCVENGTVRLNGKLNGVN